MTQLILNIPDKDMEFFMTLVKKFKYQLVKKVDDEQAYTIPEKHKVLVRERIKNSKNADLLDWEKVKDDFDGI